MIGIIGGTGLYSLSDDFLPLEDGFLPWTPISEIFVGTIGDKEVAFIPRHGTEHLYSPTAVPYYDHLFNLKQLGVSKVIGVCAVGSLKTYITPGTIVVPNQIIDLTTSRPRSIGSGHFHVSFADPYCETLRHLITKGNIAYFHGEATVVVIEGPRFSTKAESRLYSSVYQADVINMTQMPEAIFAREMGMCYAAIAVVTDYDAGVDTYTPPVTHAEVMKVFGDTLDKTRELIIDVIKTQDLTYECESCLLAPQLT